MRAIVLDEHGPRVTDHPEPVVKQGVAVVQVHLAGICRTDLELAKGYMGFQGVLGHEFVGTVIEGPTSLCGKRVVGEINFGCGHCRMCADGLRRHCPNRQVLGILGADGAFAERVALPLLNLHMVPENVPDEAAVFAEPLAAAFEILAQVHVESRTNVLVFGDGKLGLLIAQVLALAGAPVVVVGKHPAKLAILRRLGISAVTLGDWKGPPADLVVEATGTAAGLATAIAATRPRGTLVLKTTIAERHALDLAPLVINEITVVGSRCGHFRPALRALERDSIEVRSLITHRASLRDGLQALEKAAEPGALKVVLAP
jgi:threonine dehydrogenase-like Zn-dependent dehydrogenase